MSLIANLDETFPRALYHLKEFSNPYRLDRNSHGDGILAYVRDNIISNLIKLDQNFEGFFSELELCKKNQKQPSREVFRKRFSENLQ